MTLRCTMIHGDCLEVMPTLAKSSMQMCFADMPYGITACHWDKQVDAAFFLDTLWPTLTSNAAAIFSATVKFAAKLTFLLGKNLRYDLVWDKTRVSGFLNAYRAPLRRHEWLLVAYRVKPPYNIIREATPAGRLQNGQCVTSDTKTTCWNMAKNKKEYVYTDTRMPTSILSHKYSKAERGLHPTQKPVALLDWLIRTYSNEGDSVFDPVSGSGTTAVAALACGRSVTCIEKDSAYFDASVERVRKHARDNNIDAVIEEQR